MNRTDFQLALDRERDRMAVATKRGLGMPIAGLLFWLAFAALVATKPPATAALLAFFATGLVFPIGYAITRALGGDLFDKSPLASVGLIFNFSQFAYWPVLIVVYRIDPTLVPFAMAVLFGSHFAGYGWLYRSHGYWTLGIGMPVLATLLQVATPQPTQWIPLAAALVHAIAVALAWGENAHERRSADAEVVTGT